MSGVNENTHLQHTHHDTMRCKSLARVEEEEEEEEEEEWKLRVDCVLTPLALLVLALRPAFQFFPLSTSL